MKICDFPKFMNTKSKIAKTFIVNEICNFVNTPENDILMPFERNSILLNPCSLAVFKSQHMKSIVNFLKSSDCALDFKVNQEIFGNDPQKEFKKVLDFWMNHVAHNCTEKAECLIKQLHLAAYPEIENDDQFLFRIARVARKLTYTEFFDIKTKLSEFKKLSKSRHEN